MIAGLPAHLVFPRGFRQEDGPITAARRRDLRGAVLHELASDDFTDRTWTCVGLADAVILIDPAGGDGCLQTARAARDLARPLLATGGASRREPVARAAVAAWLEQTGARVLMVAGCRGSLLDSAGCRKLAAGQAAAVVCVAQERQQRLAT